VKQIQKMQQILKIQIGNVKIKTFETHSCSLCTNFGIFISRDAAKHIKNEFTIQSVKIIKCNRTRITTTRIIRFEKAIMPQFKKHVW